MAGFHLACGDVARAQLPAEAAGRRHSPLVASFLEGAPRAAVLVSGS